MSKKPSIEATLAPFRSFDKRSPLQIAIGDALERRSPLSNWPEQILDAVYTITGGRIAKMSESQLRLTMRFVDRTLSLGILFVILQKRLSASSYFDVMKSNCISGLEVAAVKLFSAVTDLPRSSVLYEEHSADDRRSLFLRCLHADDAVDAMSLLIRERRRRVVCRDQISLVAWLLENTGSGKLLRDHPEVYFGDKSPKAEQITSIIVPCEIGLLREIPRAGDNPRCNPDVLTRPDLGEFRLPHAIFINVVTKFHNLRARMPAGIKELLPRTWLECLKITDGTIQHIRKDSKKITAYRQ